MRLKIKHFVVFVTVMGLTSCKQDYKTLTKIEGKQISIDSSYSQKASIEEFGEEYLDYMERTPAWIPHIHVNDKTTA